RVCVPTNQVLLGVGLIPVLAVGSQVLASRLRMPAIIVLLPAGFIAGALTTDVNPQLLLGMSSGAALMTGAILVVSGPTVVGPLLRFVRPTERLQRVLAWEGSLIDPVGGLLGAVGVSAVLAGAHQGLAYQVGQFLVTVGIGLAGAVIGVALLWLLLRKLRLGEVVGTSAQLACVVAVAAGCDIAREDAGLLAAVVMGLAVANLRGFDAP